MTKTKTKPGANKLKESPVTRTGSPSLNKSPDISPGDKSSPKSLAPHKSKNNALTSKSNKINVEKTPARGRHKTDTVSSVKIAPSGKKEDKSLLMTPKHEIGENYAQLSSPGTPSSTVRRSGRAPVLSSKFKDMEVDLFTIRKRPAASAVASESSQNESDSEQEPPKKRGRKQSQSLSEKNSQETASEEMSPTEVVNEETLEHIECNEENVISTIEVSGANEEDVILVHDNFDKDSVSKKCDAEQEENFEARETLELPPTVDIEGSQVTLNDSETVAAVSMPLSQQSQSLKTDISDKITTLSVISLDSHFEEMGISKPPTLAVYDQDGSAYLNLTIEPTNLEAMIKDAQRTAKPPTQWHGRVLKTEQPYIVKTTVIQPTSSSTSTTVSKESQLTSPSETFSLVTPANTVKEAESSPQKSSLHGIIQATQSQQKIVIVRQLAPKPSDVKSFGPTIVRVPQDLPSKKGTTTILHLQKGPVVSSGASNTGTKAVVSALSSGNTTAQASELLLRKLQEQHKRIIVHETISASDNVIKQVSVSAELKAPEGFEEGHHIKEVTEPDHDYSRGHIQVVPVSDGVLKVMTEEEKNINEIKTVSVTLDSTTGEVIGEQVLSDTSSIDTIDSAAVLTELKNVDMNLTGVEPDRSRNDLSVDKIKFIDNGIELDMRAVTEEEVAEEVIDNTEEVQKGIKLETDVSAVNTDVELKQEPEDEDSSLASGKQTSGTQTVYSPQVAAGPGATVNTGEPTHTLTSVVDEDGQKKQIYYVSVIPNYGSVKKAKQASGQNDTNWVLNDSGCYCCGKCNYKTDRKANFYKHRRLHTGSKPHVCLICQYKAGTSSNLKRHMGIHKDIREHKCDICGLCFRQKIHLERHVKYKHEEKRVQCPMCDYVCANEQPDLKMHMKRKHSNGSSWEVVTCPQCNVEVSSRKDLKQHMKFHKDGPELKLFCKECSFVTDCQSRLKRHVAIHSKLKPFQCGVCNYRAAQKEHVLRHLRTQHKIELKKESKRPWRRHKNVETEDGSKERADFSSGDKIFACNHCVMRFAKLINLYKHLHTQHSDIMPAETDGNYFCVVCEFSTSSKKNLLVHMRRHNLIDQTPPTHVYSCVLCRYINPKRRNLFQHMRKKHNINIIGQLEGDDEGSQDAENGEVMKSVLTSVSDTEDPGDSTELQTKSKDHVSMTHVIKIENVTSGSSATENDDVQNLVIDTREDVGTTDVIHTTHTVEALEGLQALAEQAGLIDNIIEEQVPSIDDQQIVLEQQITTSEIVTPVDGQQFQIFESETENTGQVTGGLELTEEQLSSLRSGDMVEMDGELYVVELTQDSTNPNKQLLSFLPVNASS
ncbi:hypothetical protein Btru_071031 [Bulinus truncatus]|nr:hypothetical protein Btru_071031 [Bulinus truncatus]